MILDHKLDAEHVHRLEIVTRLSGASPGTEVTDAVIAAAIVKGYLPKIPKGSRHTVLLNKAVDYRLKAAESIGERLLQQGVSEVVFGEAIKPTERFYRMRPEAE